MTIHFHQDDFPPNLTFGEMEPGQKHAIDHRANAFGQLLRASFRR